MNDQDMGLENLTLQTSIPEMEDIVRLEIEEYRSNYPDLILPDYEETESHEGYYLNNFSLNVLTLNGQRAYDYYFEQGKGDTPFGELEDFDEVDEGNSDLFYAKTPKEFLADIDKVIAIHGVDMEPIQQMFEWCYESKSGKPIKQFAEIMMPIYIVLRAMGYNHKDLTS